MRTYLDNYYTQLEDSLRTIQQRIQEVNVTDEYDTEVDYAKLMNNLYQIERKIIRMLNVHRFLRISKEAFLIGEKPLEYLEVYHTVAGYENIFSIAQKYSLSVESILQLNNISINNITAGTTLKILQPNPAYPLTIREDYSVYGELDGDKILGQDLPNGLLDDGAGDLWVISPEDTIEQGIINTLTTQSGDYPGEPDFGLDFINKDSLSDDVYLNMLKVKIANSLLLDARVKDITDVTLVRTGNALKGTLRITTVNNEDMFYSYDMGTSAWDDVGYIIQAEIRIVEEFTLTSTDITNKKVTLTYAPVNGDYVTLDVYGGGAQDNGVDFSVNTATKEVSWSTLGLDGILEAGDILRITYSKL